MRLVITDTGLIWIHNNPFLEKYKDIVLVVCLEGKAVTDKYKCFVSPYDTDTHTTLGMGKYGVQDRQFQTLASVGEKLNEELGNHEKIVFLTDSQPSTLYPFYVVKECINDFCHESGHCAENVPRGAYTPQELMHILVKDDIYYRMSGGGVTFGGGEHLLQSAFIHEVCKLADASWQMRIETSLNVPWRYVEPLINDIDEWIIDIKDMDALIYKKYTGIRIDKLINNIFRLKELVDASKLHMRVPRISGYNKRENIEKSVKWIKNVLNIEPEVFDYMQPIHVNI